MNTLKGLFASHGLDYDELVNNYERATKKRVSRANTQDTDYVPYVTKIRNIINNTQPELIQEVKCNKSQLNKLITWSTSRFNEYRKSQVINTIIVNSTNLTDCCIEFRSGCYSERSHLYNTGCKFTSSNYTLFVEDGHAYLLNCVSDVRNDNLKIFEIVKPNLKSKLIVSERTVR